MCGPVQVDFCTVCCMNVVFFILLLYVLNLLVKYRVLWVIET